MKKIFAINLGATSTKVAYYEDETCVAQESIPFPPEGAGEFETLADQAPVRTAAVENWAMEHDIDFADLDAFVNYLESGLKGLTGEREELRSIFLKIYANPVEAVVGC